MESDAGGRDAVPMPPGRAGRRTPTPDRRRLLCVLAGVWVVGWLVALHRVWDSPSAGWREAPTAAQVGEALHRARCAAAVGCVPPAVLGVLAMWWRMLVPAVCLFNAALLAVLVSRFVSSFASG